MKRSAIFVLVIACLLLAGVALAQPGDSELPSPYRVEPGTAAGGRYQLAGQSMSTAVALSGGEYTLQAGIQAVATGDGCCCAYVPCLLRQ